MLLKDKALNARTKTRTPTTPYRLGSANLNGVRQKLPLLQATLWEHELSILALQESRLTQHFTDSEISIPGYDLVRADRGVNSGGGLLCYIANGIQFLPEKVHSTLEVQVIRVWNFGAPEIYLVNVYLPPPPTATIRADSILQLLQIIATLRHAIPVILVGDLNIDIREQESADLRIGLSALSIEVVNTHPTHKRRAIDWLAVEDTLRPRTTVKYSDSLEKQVSGHVLLLISISPSHPTTSQGLGPTPPRRRKLYHKADWPKAAFMLTYQPDGTKKLPPEDIRTLAPNEALDTFLAHLTPALNTCIPETSATTKRIPLSKPARELVKDTHKAYRALLADPSPAKEGHYLQLRRRKRKIIAREDAFRKERILSHTTPNTFWNAVKQLEGRSTTIIPTLLNAQGTPVFHDRAKAALIASALKNNYRDPKDASFSLEYTVCPEESQVSLSFVEDLLGHLKSSGSESLDSLCSIPLKVLKYAVAPALQTLINNVMTSMTVPKAWTHTAVVPIPKVRNSSDPKDYRPITICSPLSKVWEGWILELLRPHLPTPPLQFGFVQKCGTEDAMLYLQNKILELSTKRGSLKQSFLVVSLDAEKAFDRIDHAWLLQSLRDLEVPAYLINLLHSYTWTRTQSIRVGSELSPPMSVGSGVPQGTRIAPLLFSLALNDLLSGTLALRSSCLGFADDILLMYPLESPQDEATMQADIDKILPHLMTRGLSVNAKKSKYLILSPGRNKSIADVEIQVGQDQLTRVPELRYLGFIIDEKLSFFPHWRLACAQARSKIGALTRLTRGWRCPGLFGRIFTQKILPALLYGLPTCAPTDQRTWTLLERTQGFAARSCLRIHDRRVRSLALVRLLNWSPMYHRFRLRALLFIWKCLTAGRRFCLFLTCASPALRPLRQRPGPEIRLHLPLIMSRPISKLPLVFIINLWNSTTFPSSVSPLAITNHANSFAIP